MTQVQQERSTQQVKQDDTQSPEIPGGEARDRAAAVSADTDELLADIDDLLNELPQDLASTFRQMGGE